jgi:hypothetical protein
VEFEERVVVQESQDERVYIVGALGAVRQQGPQIFIRADLIEVEAALMGEK